MAIVRNKKICGGEPTIKGTRLTVSNILDFLAGGQSMTYIIKSYNKLGANLKKKDILDVLQYASRNVS